MATKKKTRKPGRARRAQASDAPGRPIAPKLVAELQAKIDEATAVMYQLNGALRYEQRRIAAKERREFYGKILGVVRHGVKTGAFATRDAAVSVGGHIKAGVTWLRTRKQADPETATA